MRGNDAGIGAVPDTDIPFAYDETAGLICIVGYTEWNYPKIAYREPFMITAGMAGDGSGRCFAEVKEISKRPFRCMDRDPQSPGEHIDAPRMILMLVRDKDCIDSAGINTGFFHPQEALLCAQAGIDEERAGPAFDNKTVAFAPAGKYGTAHHP